MPMPDWLAAALETVKVSEDKQATFDQLVHNEMNHGSGLSNPDSVNQALVDYDAEIKAAIGSPPANGATGATGATGGATGSTGATSATGSTGSTGATGA